MRIYTNFFEPTPETVKTLKTLRRSHAIGQPRVKFLQLGHARMSTVRNASRFRIAAHAELHDLARVASSSGPGRRRSSEATKERA